MTMESPINQDEELIHQDEPSASTPDDENPVHLECRLVLKRLPLEDTPKCQRLNSASTELDNLSVTSSDEQHDVFEWVNAIEEGASPVPSSISSCDEYDDRLEQLERTVAYLRSHVRSMEKVITRQQSEIDQLKDECNRKQCKIDQLEETIRNLSESQPLHQEGGKKESSIRRSNRKRKLGTDFSLIYFALDQLDENRPQRASEKRKSLECAAKKSRNNSSSSTLTVGSNIQSSIQDDTSHCSQSITQEKTPPLRLRVIPTERLIEKPPVRLFKEPNQVEVEIQSTFPDHWFKKVPSSPYKPPIPQKGCCLSCYEQVDNIMPRRRVCENCRRKMKTLRRRYQRNPNTFVPRCNHKLNQPMRGCDGCIVRCYILRYNVRHPNKSFIIPYDSVDVGRNSTLQPDLSIKQDAIHQRFGIPGDSSAVKTSQQVLPGLLAYQIQNIAHGAASKTVQKSTEEITLSNLLRGSPCSISNVLPAKSDPSFNKIYQEAATPMTSRVQVTPQPSISCISESPIPGQRNQISPFPDKWFLVVPDFANKPPTPHEGFCYSCYERKTDLRQQHCETCWDKAMRLRKAHLSHLKTPNPRCNHPLNRPMRGCEACILRVFIVRYNLRFPDRCFPVPYNKVDSSNDVVKYCPMPNFGVLHKAGSVMNSETEQSRGVGGSSINLPDFSPLLSSTPGGSLPSESRYGLTSEFPEKWFGVAPSDPNELPTPQVNHCMSCYEWKQTPGDHCLTCTRAAMIIEDMYVQNPKVPLPRCIHSLNLPMKGCPSCILRAYILTYNKRNPDKPYTIPYDKIDSKSKLQKIQKNSQNVIRSVNDSGECIPESSELCIVAARTLQPLSTTGTFFPNGWFQTVPDDVYELPVPRVGCCLSCYEYKMRGPDGHCFDCGKIAGKYIAAYSNGVLSIPHCTHKLNRPMRGCNTCIIRAFIVVYNKRHPSEHFPVPYRYADFEMPSERMDQLMPVIEELSPSVTPLQVFDKSSGGLNSGSTVMYDDHPSNSEGAVNGEDLHMSTHPSSIKMSVYIVHPYSTSRKAKWGVRFPQPYPPNWFLEVSDDPNVAPTPKSSHCFACYENIKRPQAGRYCNKCIDRAEKMDQGFYQSLGYAIPKCEHQLNQPMRNCVVCHMRAFASSCLLKNENSTPDNT